MLPKKVLWQCFCRSWSVGAGMSTHHLQRVGLMYALNPALVHIYPHADDLREARKRYLASVRTHTVMASLLVGLFISLETLIAKHKLSTQGIENLLHTTTTTLSAIGDSFFSGSFLVLWALGCFLCFLHGLPVGGVATVELLGMLRIWPAVIWTGFLLALVTIFRVYTFHLGVKYGLAALQDIRKFNLINWAERIKMCNAALIALIFITMTDGAQIFFWGNEFWGLVCMLIAVLLINKAHIPRIVLIAILFIVLFLQNNITAI